MRLQACVVTDERTEAVQELVAVARLLAGRRHTFLAAFGVPLHRRLTRAIERAEQQLGALQEAATDVEGS
jgi:hypothetical protein